jgi:hypothetical protein
MDELVQLLDLCKQLDPARLSELRASILEALDHLYFTFVEMGDKHPHQDNIDYARELLNVEDESPGDLIQGNYKKMLHLLCELTVLMRDKRIAILKPMHESERGEKFSWQSAKDRVDRIMAQLNSMYQLAYHTNRMNFICRESHAVPGWEALTSCPPLDPPEPKEHSDQHKLILFALHLLSMRRARRFENWVMVPKVTQTGYDSTAYTRLCEIDKFLPENIDREQNEEMWYILTSSGRILDYANRVLKDHRNKEFPELVRSRKLFAFDDGVYDAENDIFRSYKQADRRIMSIYPRWSTMTDEEKAELNQLYRDREEAYAMNRWDFTCAQDTPQAASRTPTVQEQLAASIRVQQQNLSLGDEAVGRPAACVYHPMPMHSAHNNFNLIHAPNAMDIPTPKFDKILDSQNLGEGPDGPLVKKFIYGLVGRMLYDVGEHEDWQVGLFLKGVAGTGKSTILRIIRMFYEDEDVGVMSNNIEGVFGLETLYRKLIVICFEMRGDFGLNQAELQSLMSGEPMSIKRKFKTAIPNCKWNAPIASAGNMTADWSDPTGAMGRRWVIVEFPNTIKRVDPQLMRDIKLEMPSILVKCNRCYRELVRDYGHRGPWDKDVDGTPKCLPQYFHNQKKRLTKSLNSLASFVLDSGVIVRPGYAGAEEEEEEEFYMKWQSFVDEYQKYCKISCAKMLRMTSEDSYNATFTELKLKRQLCERQDYTKGYSNVTTYWVLGCKPLGAADGAE